MNSYFFCVQGAAGRKCIDAFAGDFVSCIKFRVLLKKGGGGRFCLPSRDEEEESFEDFCQLLFSSVHKEISISSCQQGFQGPENVFYVILKKSGSLDPTAVSIRETCFEVSKLVFGRSRLLNAE